jgi:hypothetical protein
MGGQVAKWALRTMEIQGKNHDAALYISFDSPQRGASIPLCVQSFLWFNASFGDAASRAAVAPRWNAINRPAAQQLLMHHFNKIEQTNGCDLRQLFADEMTQLGYPRSTRNIATANGSGIGTGQGYVNSSLLADVKGKTKFLGIPITVFDAKLSASGASTISDVSKITGQGFTIALTPPTLRKDITSARIVVSLLNSNQIQVNVTRKEEHIGLGLFNNPTFTSISNNTLTFNHDIRSWDNAPGGNRRDITRSLIPEILKSLNGFDTFRTIPISDAINSQAFIPSISALDIQTGIDNVNINILSMILDKDAPASGTTPFSAVFFAPINENHVQVSDPLGDFIIAQMKLVQVTLQSPLAEPYNYGLIRTVIPSVIIVNGGILGINNNGRTAYVNRTTSEAPASKAVFETIATSACNSNIVVQSGGQIQLGAGWSNSGVLRIGKGSTVNLLSGSTTQANNASQIVIENGGKLIINAGATVNLAGANSRIIVQNGGELIINGQFNGANGLIGNGHIRFEQGNIFTLNSNLLLAGSGINNPLIKIANGATLTVSNPFEFLITEGTIYRETGNLASQRNIWLRNKASFRAHNVIFDGQSVVLDQAAFVEVEDPDDINNDPDDIDYGFTNCRFQNTKLAVKLYVSNAITTIFDWRNVNVQFINCEFINCQALKAERSFITIFDGCTLTNSTIDIAHTYWLNVRNTQIRSTFGSAATAIKGTHLGHFWFRENCLIDNWGTGIDLTSGLNWNLIMTDGSTIQQCGIGINLNGSQFNQNVDLGILHMDCARMIQNGTAVIGRDIIFSAYMRDPNFNTFTKSPNNPNGHYIESVFQNRAESDLWLHGNFWDGAIPPPTPVNAFWSFMTQPIPQGQTPWNGIFHLDNTRTDANNTVCGGVQLRGEKEDPLSKYTIVKVNGIYRDVKVQYDAAFKHIKEKKLKKALDALVVVAEIPRTVRDTASPVVKHFVDIAQAMTLKIGVGTRSSNDGWLPESLVETPREIADNQMIVSPNPANNAVQIELKKGNYTLRVANTIGQVIFEQNTEGVLSVNVSTWTNGIYLFEVMDKATKKPQRTKIVVQH